MKVSASTVEGDIPMKLVKEFACELSSPLAYIISRAISHGEYPNLWKIETVTPVPKVFPPENPEQLRKISGLLNFSKIAEKLLSNHVIQDMKPFSDQSQYGNKKGVSINHYLIKMVHKILTGIDTNSSSKASYGSDLRVN